MSEAAEGKFDYGGKEYFMAGYLVGLTIDERVSDEELLEMFEKSSIKEIQALVKIIKEQLTEGVIEKDAAVKFLGKKFLEFAKNNSLIG